MSKSAIALVCATLLVPPLASCVAAVSDPDAAVSDSDVEANWIEVDDSSAKAAADDFKRWYKAEFGEERARAEFGEDPK